MSSNIVEEASAAGPKAILYAKGAVQDPTIIGDCPFTHKARLGLAGQGINNYTLKIEDMSNKSADLLKANPKGTVPVWVCPSGSGSTTVIADSEDILQQLCPDVVGRTTVQEKEIIDKELKAFQSAWFTTMKTAADPSTLIEAVDALDASLASLPSKKDGRRLTELEAKLCPLLYQYSVAGVHYRKLPGLPTKCAEMLRSIEGTPEWKATVYSPESMLAGWKKFF
ncbi:Chloride intracellular channel protein 4 [Perkinsus olseni]|uniref:Chloride intracellular channel protein 4 n=2 Tax=Perkinsus olseni TaxID=32597 RepID=A0A7J6NXG8_PEROL|nr:Chloride intracellular channel protein 4 [Perkinsus olseni]